MFQVYVSPAGLLTVLLKHDVAVEMTLDRTIRVVNHKHKSVAASNSKGTASCIYHGLAKVRLILTSFHIKCFNAQCNSFVLALSDTYLLLGILN